jgi:Transmembrane secretion effector
MFAGPALAGIMLANVPVWSIFALNAGGYGVYIACLGMMRLPPATPLSGMRGSLFAEFREGLDYVAAHRGIAPLFVLGLCGDTLNKAMVRLAPAFSDEVLRAGASGMAAITAAIGVGATLAAVLIALRGNRPGLLRFTIAGFVLALLAAGAFSTSFMLWPSVAAAAAFGAGSEAALTGATVMIQTNVDEKFRSRVMGSRFLLSQICGSLTLFVLGPMVDWLGFKLPLLIVLVLCGAATAWLVRRRDAIEAGLTMR